MNQQSAAVKAFVSSIGPAHYLRITRSQIFGRWMTTDSIVKAGPRIYEASDREMSDGAERETYVPPSYWALVELYIR